jgi:hypothetical protein
MKRRMSVVLLVLLFVFANQAVTASQASASARPYFQWYGVMANNHPTGMQTLLDVTVADPDGSVPTTIKSLTVNGPGIHYEFSPSEYSSTGGDYWQNLPGLPADGEYTFTVTDIDNNTATTYSYLTVGGIVPLPDPTTFQSSGTDPLTPTLSWSTIPGYPWNLFYRAKVLTEAGADVWSSSRTFNTTSVKVPSGVLASGQSYCWRVDAFDNFSLQNGNTRSTSDCIPLNLSNTHPYFTSVGGFKIHNADGSFATGLSVQGADPAGSVPSLVITDPNGVKHTYASQSCFTPTTTCNYSFPGAPADGLFTFAATNADNNTAVSYFYLDSYTVPLINPDTMHASGNPLTQVLSWSAPAAIDRPLYYYVFVRDAVTQAAVWSNWTAQSTSISVPQGKLQAGVSYQWQIIANDSTYFNVSNRSLTPWKPLTVDNASPYFWYAQLLNRNKPEGEFAAFDIGVRDRNGACPGSLASLSVTGPGGFSYTFQPSDYSASDNNFYHEAPGAANEGLYTFTLTDNNGTSVITHDYHKHGGGAIPLLDEKSFQVSGDPLAPTISWSAVYGYPYDLYYRLRIVNQQGTTVFAPSSPWGPATFQTVQPGALAAGPSYRYRVEAFDGRYVMASDNRVGSIYLDFGVPSISGRVTNGEGTGLANISVQAYNAVTGASTPTVPTDANGDYLLSNLPSGNYRIFFSGVGYFSEWYNNKTSQPSADLVAVTAPDLTSGIDAVLERSGGISGTVKNGQGVGIQNVWVHVHNADGYGLFGTSTDQNGRYALSSMGTGNYKVRFNAPQGYLTECYNNKATLNTSDLIPVTAPNMTSGIDATLELGGSISGKVKNGQGAGIPNVQVQVNDLNGTWAAGVRTNQNGDYMANGLAAGSYKVSFSPPSTSGYSSEWYNNKPDQASADPVPVTVPNITSGIDAVLDQGGSISGTVKNGQGVGIANVQVQLYDAVATDTSAPKSSIVTTDQSGSYTVTGLPTGSYKLFFSGVGYFSDWFNSKANQGSADPVSVTAPNLTSGIDAVLEPSGGISGTVKNGAGVGIANVNAQVFDTNGSWMSNAITNSTGSYTASNLATGSYRVCFWPPGGYRFECYNDKPTQNLVDLVAVTVPNITSGIDATLEPGGSISGTVNNGQGAGIANVTVQVYDLTGMWAAGLKTNQNGGYTANGLAAGSYRVFFSPPSTSGYSSEWYNNKPDQASADTVPVTVPNITTGIDAVLDQGGSLSGTVKNVEGAGIPNVQIQVYDAAATDTSAPKSSTVTTDQSGGYTVTGLPTGSYKLFFAAIGYYSEWYNNKADQTSATPVSVTAPNTKSGINVVLERSGGISGTVKNGAGVGIRNVWVHVHNADGYGLFGTSTDQDGRYALSSLATGNYKIRFNGSSGYLNECYNNKATLDISDLIPVIAPNMTSGIDAVLEPGGSISGTVKNSQGTGIANAGIQIYDLNGMWASGAGTNQSGGYTANGLAAGSYKVFFSPPADSGYSSEWYDNKANRDSASSVSVTVPNITSGIDAVLELGGSIAGKVKNGAGVGIGNAQVQVYDAADTDMNTPRSTATTNQSGTYTLKGLPTGSYKVFFSGIGYYSEWYNDKTSQGAANPVSVTAPNTTSGINAVLAQSGSISGTIKNGAGVGVGNVWVTIYDSNWNHLFGTPTNQDGSYTASGLATGNYKVCFNGPGGYRTEWYNNKATQESADWVAVTVPNVTSGIDAVLEPGGSISGTVKNAQGTGIAGVGVSAFYLDGKWASGTGTNQNGGYTLTGLPAGSYKVLFSPSPDTGCSSEWYNNKATQDSAHPVSVTVPNVTSGIDAVLANGGILTVTSPNGSETWEAGSTHNITWAYAGSPGSLVGIQLLKGGAVVSTIVTSTAIGGDGSGSCPWTLPSGMAGGNDYRVKITSVSDGSITDTSDGNFAISVQPASVTVVSPNGGENWSTGSAQAIVWTFTGDPGANVKITLLKAGKLVSTIAEAVSAGKDGNGSFSWTIPASQTAGNNYQISVTSTSASSCTDTSDASFSIKPPQPITVLAPTGGENWKVGYEYTIMWKRTVDIGKTVKIELIKGDAVVKTIVSSTGSGSSGTGSYPWTIPNNLAYGRNCRIKVTANANTSFTDTSDEVFTISGPTLDVTAPDGGESWLRGSQHNITWTYTENPGGKVKIQLLKAGVLLQTLTPSPVSVGSEGQGSFAWTISQDLKTGSNYQIKISHTTFTRCKATSSGNFRIAKAVAASSAGPDQKVAEAQQVKLSGSNSTGFDKSTSTFSWRQLDGPPITLSNPAAVDPLFTAPEAGTEGRSLTFQLTVTGTDGAQAQDQCIVNVTEGSMPPIAEAGPTQPVMSGQKVVLDGSGSHDPEDDLVRYYWKQLAGSQVSLSDPASAQPTFTAPEGREEGQTLVFQLTVTDRDGLRSRDTCIVNIVAANLPPKADAGPDQIVVPGAQVTLDGSKSVDQDSDFVSFRWQQLAGPPVTLSDPTAVQPFFLAPGAESSYEPLVFQLTVTDGGNLMDKSRVAVVIGATALGGAAQ